MVIKLKIDSKRDFLDLYWDLRKAGLLGNVTVYDVTIPESRFPIEIPVNIDGLTKLANHPVVRPFKKMIDNGLSENVKKIKRQMA